MIFLITALETLFGPCALRLKLDDTSIPIAGFHCFDAIKLWLITHDAAAIYRTVGIYPDGMFQPRTAKRHDYPWGKREGS